jgi:hypothetical protein
MIYVLCVTLDFDTLLTGLTAMLWFKTILARPIINTTLSILHTSWTTIAVGGN